MACKKLKVLWLCNIVLPELAEEFGIKKSNFGGWMSALLRQICNDVDIAVCCPIIDDARKKDGKKENIFYYSFSASTNDYNNATKERFIQIIKDFKPNVIHIWGTEYPHTLACVHACDALDMLEKVVIHIQGLVSVCFLHYCAGVPQKYLTMIKDGFNTIKQDAELFLKKGLYEIEALKKVKHVIGRTNWDKACTTQINPLISYHFCGEIMRDEFYSKKNTWQYKNCQKHSIFVSQAGYPLKGFHVLLKALPILLKKYPNVHVFVGGSNITVPNKNGTISPYGQYIADVIQQNNLNDHVTFLGLLSPNKMIEQYLKSNVFVSASSIENSSNSICEAALLGVPVVSSFVGGIKTIASFCNNIFLYQQDAPYMLAYYLAKVFEKTDYANTKNAIYEYLNPEQNAKRTLEIYNLLAVEVKEQNMLNDKKMTGGGITTH